MQKIETVTKQVLQQIAPEKSDIEKVEAITRELELKVASACKGEGIAAIVRVEGSVAKDTWLRENPDIDIFMRLPTSIQRKDLGEVGLRIAKKAAGNYEQIERFAEHPYLEVFVQGYRIDIVPCYDTKPGEWQSATDRTPYHTDYIRKHLTAELRSEVRLLKRFMQGTDVYGAEIKVGGFSGYLCELLVMKYGSFVRTLEAFAYYNRRVVVDIEDYYAGRQRELSLLFPEPMVIVDPVDKGRNVASAVQPDKLYNFIAASRSFLQKPSNEFFFPPKSEPFSLERLKTEFENHGSSTLFLVIEQVPAVPDVLWGQLYKTKRSVHKLIGLSDHKILKDAVWSNEKSLSIFVFELEQQILSNIKKHLGPPLEREPECESFLAKYAVNDQVISGPTVEDGRWVVLLPRKTTDIVALLMDKLAGGGKNSGVPDLIAESIRKKLRVMVNGEIGGLYSENVDFAVFLTEFLYGKPFWLKNQ